MSSEADENGTRDWLKLHPKDLDGQDTAADQNTQGIVYFHDLKQIGNQMNELMQDAKTERPTNLRIQNEIFKLNANNSLQLIQTVL